MAVVCLSVPDSKFKKTVTVVLISTYRCDLSDYHSSELIPLINGTKNVCMTCELPPAAQKGCFVLKNVGTRKNKSSWLKASKRLLSHYSVSTVNRIQVGL